MINLKTLTSTTFPALALTMAFLAIPERAFAASEPYVGEIALTGITGFCPNGWLSAEGQILPITNYSTLFSLLGTTFGGDGRSSFALPDLRSRVPMGQGNGPGLTRRNWGAKGGQEIVTLTKEQMASHAHAVNANNLDGDKGGPKGRLLAAAPNGGSGTETIYSNQPATVTMSEQMIATSGESAAIYVQDPSLVLRYCIALVGYYPPRN